jgi:hypothetical protein
MRMFVGLDVHKKYTAIAIVDEEGVITKSIDQIQAERLSVHETRKRVREMLGKEFKWRLVPVRLSPETYEAL